MEVVVEIMTGNDWYYAKVQDQASTWLILVSWIPRSMFSHNLPCFYRHWIGCFVMGRISQLMIATGTADWVPPFISTPIYDGQQARTRCESPWRNYHSSTYLLYVTSFGRVTMPGPGSPEQWRPAAVRLLTYEEILSRSARWASVDLARFRLWCYTPLKFYTRDRWVVPSDSAGNAYSHNQETDSESLWLSVNLCRVISVPTSTAESSSSITLSFCNAWYRYDHRIHDNDLVFCIEHEIFKSSILSMRCPNCCVCIRLCGIKVATGHHFH